MNRSHVIGIVCLLLCLFTAFGAYELSKMPPTMSAAGDVVKENVTFAQILGWISSGSAIASLTGFLGLWTKIQATAQPIIHQLFPNVNLPIVPNPDGVLKAVEAVASAVAYASNSSDKAAQARYANAQLAEIRDIYAGNESIQDSLNSLAMAITNSQFPVKPKV